jgi:hypothetical protein
MRTSDDQLEYATQVLREWRGLLEQSVDEHVYHSFVAEHAGLFLPTSIHEAVVISKLKLGSEFETDFVIVKDDFSQGLKYTLIELETPHCKRFTSLNKPSVRLNSALAQIASWRQHIDEHRTESKDIFPSGHKRWNGPRICDYMIIIGRRTSQQKEPKIDEDWQRGWRGDADDISIRSFDYLTSQAESKIAFLQRPQSLLRPSAFPPRLAPDLNRIDWRALTHAEWREMIRRPNFTKFHLLEWNSESILQARKGNLSITPPTQLPLVREIHPDQQTDT